MRLPFPTPVLRVLAHPDLQRLLLLLLLFHRIISCAVHASMHVRIRSTPLIPVTVFSIHVSLASWPRCTLNCSMLASLPSSVLRSLLRGRGGLSCSCGQLSSLLQVCACILLLLLLHWCRRRSSGAQRPEVVLHTESRSLQL